VITARPGALVDVTLGCLLPPMTIANRGSYGLLKNAIEARLNTALRINQGDGYGVDVMYERLRSGAAYLVAATFVPDDSLTTALSTLRDHWERWAHTGFEAGELNVARWRYAGGWAASGLVPHALAYQLLADWSTEPGALATDDLRPDVFGPRAAGVNELFATCKANAVLGLTGNEPLIRRALGQAWPGLGAAAAR